jgi:hypothetical protein
MRHLFLSEKRSIENIIQKEWNSSLRSDPLVVKEFHWDPFTTSKRHKFNSDFVLDFVENFIDIPTRAGAMHPALPNTLGAELYLYIDTRTFSPLHLELMSGSAFPISYYKQYVADIDAALRTAINLQPVEVIRSSFCAVSDAAYVRILVIRSDVCFLFFPRETEPVMRGSPKVIACGDDRAIDCYIDGDEVVCFDGWIRTNVVRGDQVLVALPDDH